MVAHDGHLFSTTAAVGTAVAAGTVAVEAPGTAAGATGATGVTVVTGATGAAASGCGGRRRGDRRSGSRGLRLVPGCLAEFANALAHGPADLGQPTGAEDDHHDQQYDDEFPRAERRHATVPFLCEPKDRHS